MPKPPLILALVLSIAAALPADESLLKAHCAKCHGGKEPKGDLDIRQLGALPTAQTTDLWAMSLDFVKAGEMPPAEQSRLSANERAQLVRYFQQALARYDESQTIPPAKPRRLNNREFANSVRDALLLEDVGTHLPMDDLIGDTLHEGFDTHGDSLGFSKFHLEQMIEAIRRVVDATVLTGDRPRQRRIVIPPTQIFSAHTSQNTTRPERRGKRTGFDFLDPQRLAYFKPFANTPHTGWYRITLQATGKDRGVYDAKDTGMYPLDPIRLRVRMGDRQRTFALPDEDILEIELEEWLAADTRLQMQHPTDGLRLRGNGNYKFQNAIAGEYLKAHDPQLYDQVVAAIKPTKSGRILRPASWHHWVDYWRGPRPRILGAVVEGPFYKSWPPLRQQALLGKDPKAEDALAILKPIANRAWRREVHDGELASIVQLVADRAANFGDVEALKEGIVAILASPPFLLLFQEELTPEEQFASKLSTFLSSTLPDERLRAKASKLDSLAAVREEVADRVQRHQAEPFLTAFPRGWLKLHEINFMAPDPDRYRRYHRKRVSEDMVNEALHFFRHTLEHNLPVTEMLSADYSFINADLAEVYGVDGVPQDSVFRKTTFADGRRGGLLGMGAFLTVTADSLGTSPIHRAIFVMENFLGMHPAPPPPDVNIQEPDVRSAKTIKEVLAAHRSDESCAACHRAIDPFGYAFENFDPTGAWRELYQTETTEPTKPKRRARPQGIPIDASATFRNGTSYRDIVEFRQLMQAPANQERFVRCFVTKLLLYANGEAPTNTTAIDQIVAVSADHDYRIVDTIAAVIDSRLFRDE